MAERTPDGVTAAVSLEQLARSAQNGDARALTTLIRTIQDDVHRLALRMLWHPDDAADATQEILFKVVTNLGTFRGESSVRTWILRVATNHVLNIRRSRVEEQRLTFEAFGDDLATGLTDVPASAAYDPEQALLEEEVKIGCTQAMLLCLDRDDRVTYILGDVFELRSDEGGVVLGIGAAAFRKRLSRVRARVRAFMGGHCGLIEATAACRCVRRVAPAIAQGRIDPRRLLFATGGEPGPKRLPVLEALGESVLEMERLHGIAALHQARPVDRAPERITAELTRVLETAAPRLLSNEGQTN
jgi:RNA polymerase sigma factor (sigma-70 family)